MDWGNFIGTQVVNGSAMATLTAGVIALIVIIAIWSLVWKGFALWKAAKKNHLVWFIVLLILNTVGILEILYIFVFSKMGSAKEEQVKKKRR